MLDNENQIATLFRYVLDTEFGGLIELANNLDQNNIQIVYLAMVTCSTYGEPHRVVSFTCHDRERVDDILRFPTYPLYQTPNPLSRMKSLYNFLLEHASNGRSISALLSRPKNWDTMNLAISPYINSDPENFDREYNQACDAIRTKLSKWSWCKEILEDIFVLSFPCPDVPGSACAILEPLAEAAPKMEPLTLILTQCNNGGDLRLAVKGSDAQKTFDVYDKLGWDFDGHPGSFRPYVSLTFQRQFSETLLGSLIDELTELGIVIGRLFTFPTDSFESTTVYCLD